MYCRYYFSVIVTLMIGSLRLFQSWLVAIGILVDFHEKTAGTGQEGSSASHKACEKPLSGEWGGQGVKQVEIWWTWISRCFLSGMWRVSLSQTNLQKFDQDLQHPVCKKSFFLMLLSLQFHWHFVHQGWISNQITGKMRSDIFNPSKTSNLTPYCTIIYWKPMGIQWIDYSLTLAVVCFFVDSNWRLFPMVSQSTSASFNRLMNPMETHRFEANLWQSFLEKRNWVKALNWRTASPGCFLEKSALMGLLLGQKTWD